jgi:hypothetical protein
MLGRAISDDKADELNERNNRRSISIMDDGLFFQLSKDLENFPTTDSKTYTTFILRIYFKTDQFKQFLILEPITEI